jgi:two-component system response regulator RegX3
VRILLADDDPNILEPLEQVLRRDGHEVVAAGDGDTAWDLFTLDRPDFAVLDVSMPGLDGFALTRRIAATGEPRVPIILLTARGHERDKVSALDAGADDYVVKPCSHRELLARIRAVWRRAGTPSRLITVGNLTIDPATHKFYLDGRTVEVTTNEFLLLLTLMERAGHVVRYAALMHRVWGTEVSNDLLRVTIYRLRRKIEPDASKPRYIHTVPGVGFLLEAPYPIPDGTPSRMPHTS